MGAMSCLGIDQERAWSVVRDIIGTKVCGRKATRIRHLQGRPLPRALIFNLCFRSLLHPSSLAPTTNHHDHASATITPTSNDLFF